MQFLCNAKSSVGAIFMFLVKCPILFVSCSSFYKGLALPNKLATNYSQNFTATSIMAAVYTRSVSQTASEAK
jgi:hypothetical protein